MARKLRGLERVLDAPRLFAVAYDEIGSSLYFALGIVAGYALGLTPVVLLGTGLLFLVVALSYAEGTSAIPETGGGMTFTRRVFGDVPGFLTGWALLLDYLIVIALAALFLPHYVGAALGATTLRESGWDVVVGALVVAAIAGARLVRRQRLHTGALAVAGLDLAVQLLLVTLGLAFLLEPAVLGDGLGLAEGQSVDELLFAIPLAMLAYTGLETAANLAEETREPGRALPRSLFSSIGLVVLVTVLIAAIGVSAFPAQDGESALAEEWLEAPIVGIVTAFEGTLPDALVDVLRVVVGLSGALVLFSAVATAMSGCARLTHSMGTHGMLPREFGRLERRSLLSSEATVLTALVAIGILVATGIFAGDDPVVLASVYSFGVLLAFTAAQVAVIALRVTEPALERPFRVRPNVRVLGFDIPVPALVGVPLTFGIWVLSMFTHPGARYAGPAWLAVGLAVLLFTRRRLHVGAFADVGPRTQLPPGASYRKVLVPMKAGDVGAEMLATALAIGRDRGAAVEALYVVALPRALALDAPLPPDLEGAATASLEEARALGEDVGVELETSLVRARSIGHAIVDEAAARGADLIVLGSAPRWRRQSRFFSPTVDHVLRHAPCEVLVVAFPHGTFEGAA